MCFYKWSPKSEIDGVESVESRNRVIVRSRHYLCSILPYRLFPSIFLLFSHISEEPKTVECKFQIKNMNEVNSITSLLSLKFF